MMRALALSLLGFPAQADTVNCELVDGMLLSFVIDRNQFVTAVSPEEPIRRKVTVVRMGDDTLPAEPFLIGDMRGFHAEGAGDSQIMFVVHKDGTAQLTSRREGLAIDGTCEVTP
jgi:hypothetical protein